MWMPKTHVAISQIIGNNKLHMITEVCPFVRLSSLNFNSSLALLLTEIVLSHLVLGYNDVSEVWLHAMVWFPGDYLGWNVAKWFLAANQRGQDQKKLKMLWKASFKYSPAHSHAHTNNQSLPRGTIWIYTDEFLWGCGWQEKRKNCQGSSNYFFMTMFHCFDNKTGYAESRASGLTAGCSGPLWVI